MRFSTASFLTLSCLPLCYAGPEEDAAQAAADKAAADATAAAAADAAKNKGKTFTQEELNRIQAEDRRKFQVRLDALAAAAQNADELQKALEATQASLRTTEEQAAFEAARLRKEAEGKVETLTAERDSWKVRFENQTKATALTSAAALHEAFQVEQVVALLEPKTTIVEEVVDGKKTGKFVPQVRISLPDTKGVMTELRLSPEDAVKRMKETPSLYGNLFQSHLRSGMGGRGNFSVADAQAVSFKGMSVEDYQKNRAEIAKNYRADGSTVGAKK